MRRLFVLALIALCTVFSLLACASNGFYDSPSSSSPSTSSSTTSSAGQLRIDNRSSLYIYYVYVSPADEMYWGEDMLEVDVLAPGEYAMIALDRGVWDIKVVAEDGQEVIYYDVDFSSDDMVLTLTERNRRARQCSANLRALVLATSGSSRTPSKPRSTRRQSRPRSAPSVASCPCPAARSASP